MKVRKSIEKTVRKINKGIILTETGYPSHLKLPKHSHENAYFCFVVEGNFTENYGASSRLGRPSMLIFNPKGEVHTDIFHTETRCFDIQMEDSWLEQYTGRYMGKNMVPADFYGSHPAFIASQMYREFQTADRVSALALEGLTLELLASLYRLTTKTRDKIPPRWLVQVKELLTEQFHENFTQVSLARSAGVHPTHLAREFRQFFGCTIGEYVRKRRIESVCQQISTTDAPLSEIALAAGFFDQSHLTRAFKLQTGITPRQYCNSFRPRH
jgi:AraC family transcriptional regulator